MSVPAVEVVFTAAEQEVSAVPLREPSDVRMERSPIHYYSPGFLLSFSDLEICKKKPPGLDLWKDLLKGERPVAIPENARSKNPNWRDSDSEGSNSYKSSFESSEWRKNPNSWRKDSKEFNPSQQIYTQNSHSQPNNYHNNKPLYKPTKNTSKNVESNEPNDNRHDRAKPVPKFQPNVRVKGFEVPKSGVKSDHKHDNTNVKLAFQGFTNRREMRGTAARFICEEHLHPDSDETTKPLKNDEWKDEIIFDTDTVDEEKRRIERKKREEFENERKRFIESLIKTKKNMSEEEREKQKHDLDSLWDDSSMFQDNNASESSDLIADGSILSFKISKKATPLTLPEKSSPDSTSANSSSMDLLSAVKIKKSSAPPGFDKILNRDKAVPVLNPDVNSISHIQSTSSSSTPSLLPLVSSSSSSLSSPMGKSEAPASADAVSPLSLFSSASSSAASTLFPISSSSSSQGIPLESLFGNSLASPSTMKFSVKMPAAPSLEEIERMMASEVKNSDQVGNSNQEKENDVDAHREVFPSNQHPSSVSASMLSSSKSTMVSEPPPSAPSLPPIGPSILSSLFPSTAAKPELQSSSPSPSQTIPPLPPPMSDTKPISPVFLTLDEIERGIGNDNLAPFPLPFLSNNDKSNSSTSPSLSSPSPSVDILGLLKKSSASHQKSQAPNENSIQNTDPNLAQVQSIMSDHSQNQSRPLFPPQFPSPFHSPFVNHFPPQTHPQFQPQMQMQPPFQPQTKPPHSHFDQPPLQNQNHSQAFNQPQLHPPHPIMHSHSNLSSNLNQGPSSRLMDMFQGARNSSNTFPPHPFSLRDNSRTYVPHPFLPPNFYVEEGGAIVDQRNATNFPPYVPNSSSPVPTGPTVAPTPTFSKGKRNPETKKELTQEERLEGIKLLHSLFTSGVETKDNEQKKEVFTQINSNPTDDSKVHQLFMIEDLLLKSLEDSGHGLRENNRTYEMGRNGVQNKTVEETMNQGMSYNPHEKNEDSLVSIGQNQMKSTSDMGENLVFEGKFWREKVGDSGGLGPTPSSFNLDAMFPPKAEPAFVKELGVAFAENHAEPPLFVGDNTKRKESRILKLIERSLG